MKYTSVVSGAVLHSTTLKLLDVLFLRIVFFLNLFLLVSHGTIFSLLIDCIGADFAWR